MSTLNKENKLEREVLLLTPIVFLDYIVNDCGECELLAGSSGKVGIKSDFFEDILKAHLSDILKDKQDTEKSLNVLVEEYMLELLQQKSEKIFSEILPTKDGLLLEDLETLDPSDFSKIKIRDKYKNSYLYINQDSKLVKLLKENFKSYLEKYFGEDMELAVPFFDALDYIEYTLDKESGDVLVDNLIQASVLTRLRYIMEIMKSQEGLEGKFSNLTEDILNKESRSDLPLSSLITLIVEPLRLNYFK